MDTRINLIVAYDSKKGIAKNNMIPWYIKEDSDFFQDVTSRVYIPDKKNVLIMGKNTWKALPSQHRALKNRITVVISSTMTNDELQQENTTKEEVYLVSNFMDAVTSNNPTTLKIWDKVGYVFICGGSKIYEEALKTLDIDYYYITEIDGDYGCDTVFPYNDLHRYLSDSKIDGNNCKNAELMDQKTFKVMDQMNDKQVNITFSKYRNLMTDPSNIMKVNPEENQYQNLLYEILQKGHFRQTRNSKTWSLFGKTLEFDLSKGYPLLTTKKMFFRGVFEELLFFLKGDTNAKHLSDIGVKIWDANTSRDFLDKNNLGHYDTFDMGTMYGFQLKHFNADYKGADVDYSGQGIDQIQYCLDLLKTDPYSRRIIMTTFNPQQKFQGVLFPCHGLFIQFYVEGDNKLSCMMTQRSGDAFLGI